MMNADDMELAGVRSAFCMLIARWRLTQSEVAMVLGGTAGPFRQGRVLPDRLDVRAETRLRLLLRLDGALTRLAPDDDIAALIRGDVGTGGVDTPLQALGDEPVLRAAIALAEERCVDNAGLPVGHPGPTA